MDKIKCRNCGSENIIQYPKSRLCYCGTCDTNMEFVWEFLYNSDVHEGGAVTVSVHRSKKGADMAMEFHKNAKLKEWEKECKEYPPAKEYPFDFDQGWGVKPIELLP